MKTQIHTILPGQTLSGIAKINQITFEELLEINPQIQDPDLIQADQPINIPGEALLNKDWPIWYGISYQELAKGVHEIAGNQHTRRIIEYHQCTSLQATSDEIAWCSSFVNWCMVQADKKNTNSASARSWLPWGKPLEEPQLGCIVVLKRGKQPWQGHVGFYIEHEDEHHIKVLGGNQSNKVKISTYRADKVLGYRWPT